MGEVCIDSRLQCLSPEMQTLVVGVRGQLPAADLDWENIGRLAGVHGIAPLLHRAWHPATATVPRVVLDEFKRRRRQTLLRGTWGERQRDELVEILTGERIPSLVLKGAALAREWYGDLSLRPFLDIDILVPENERLRARAALGRAGYRALPDTIAPHHLAPLARDGAPCTVELHHRLTRLPARSRLDFAELYARSISLQSNATIRTLGPEDTLIHLCLHLLSHVDYDHGWQIRHVWDIARHVTVFTIDWAIVAARASGAGSGRATRAALGLAVLVAGAQVPVQEIDEVAALELLQYPLAGEIDHRLLAVFVDAICRVDLRRAGLMAATAAKGASGDRRNSATRSPGLVPITGRLFREGIKDPGHLTAQLRLWLPEAKRLRRREGLLTALLAE